MGYAMHGSSINALEKLANSGKVVKNWRQYLSKYAAYACMYKRT